MDKKLYGGFTLDQAANDASDFGEVARDLLAERSNHADTRRMLRIAHDALRERVSADDAKDAEWRAAALEDLRLRVDTLSPHERKRERWARYAAGASTRNPLSAAEHADQLLAMEEKRFGKAGEP